MNDLRQINVQMIGDGMLLITKENKRRRGPSSEARLQ